MWLVECFAARRAWLDRPAWLDRRLTSRPALRRAHRPVLYDPTLYGLLNLAALGVIPVAITIAVTRYKLFEIDRIISRTVSYALVVGLLVAVFFGLVTLVTAVLPPDASDLAIAASTLAVAALFNPLRKRVQHAVDRRFNRSSYQAARLSEQFAARLDQPHTVEEIAELWKQTVNESLQPQASGLWLNPTHND